MRASASEMMQRMNVLTGMDFDSESLPYLNVKVERAVLDPFRDYLKRILGQETFFHYTKNQEYRDSCRYHITVINPIEYPGVNQTKIKPFTGYPVEVSFLGIGRAEEGKNQAYFVVCQSRELREIRSALALPPQDFHVTLGFRFSDIFDRPKDKSSLVFPFGKIEDSL